MTSFKTLIGALSVHFPPGSPGALALADALEQYEAERREIDKARDDAALALKLATKAAADLDGLKGRPAKEPEAPKPAPVSDDPPAEVEPADADPKPPVKKTAKKT